MAYGKDKAKIYESKRAEWWDENEKPDSRELQNIG